MNMPAHIKTYDFIYSIPVNQIEFNETVSSETYEFPVQYVTEQERIINIAKSFLLFHNDWNGVGSIPPKQDTVDNIYLFIDNLQDKYLKLLDNEDIVPSSHGTISLYFYDSNNNELSIEFGENLIGLCGTIDGDIKIIDSIPIHEFDIAIELVKKLKFTI